MPLSSKEYLNLLFLSKTPKNAWLSQEGLKHIINQKNKKGQSL